MYSCQVCTTMASTTAGTVYVLTNDSLKSMVKIGYTTRSAAIRAKELSGTSLPTPFVVAYESEKVEDVRKVERAVHADLLGSRIQNGREFFKVTPAEAIGAIKAAIVAHGNQVVPLQEDATHKHVVTIAVPAHVTEVVVHLEKLAL